MDSTLARILQHPAGKRNRRTTGYQGFRLPAGATVLVTQRTPGDPSQSSEYLHPRPELSTSPTTDFGWGPEGPGLEQLAVAILAHAADDNYAVRMANRFKQEVIRHLPHHHWHIPLETLAGWIKGNPAQPPILPTATG